MESLIAMNSLSLAVFLTIKEIIACIVSLLNISVLYVAHIQLYLSLHACLICNFIAYTPPCTWLCIQVSLLFVAFIFVNSAVLDVLFFTDMLVFGQDFLKINIKIMNLYRLGNQVHSCMHACNNHIGQMLHLK